MAKFDIKSYIKNVVKSTGYIMTDVAKETNPIVTDFINTNSDTIKDMYSFVKDFKRNVGQKKEALADNEYAQLAKDTVHNFFDDIKTGKFYNVERSKGAEDELMRSMMGDDFNMDFDTDDWDFEDESSGFGNLDEEKSDSLTSSDMDVIGGKITDGISKSNILSADYIVKSSRANTKKVIANNEVLFGRVNTSISAVNASIASLGKAIIPALSTHVDNSSKFYAKTTEQLTEMNEYIKKIYEILDKNVDIKEKEKKARKSSTFADSVTYNGAVNLSGWGKSIKKNVESQLGALTIVTSMLEAFGGTAAIKSMLSSPVALIASMALSNLMTNRYGQNIKAINSLAGGLFGKFQMSLMKSKGNGFMGLVRDLLGVSPNTKHSIDTSKYDKGPKQWDGRDSKALQEVIPRQLSMILSALTGRDPEIFNYETGRWGTIKDLRSHMVKKINKIAYDSQNEFNEKFKTVSGFERASKDYKSQLTRESEVFHRYVMFHLKHMPTSVKQWDNLKKIMQKAAILEGGKGPGQISLRTFNMLKSSYLQLKDSDRLMMETNYLRARDETGSYFEESEEKGTYSAMLSGGYNIKSKLSKVNLITNAIDDKGHNIFFYLQNYYNQLETLITKIANNPMDPRKIKKLKRNGKYNPVTPNQLSINSDSLVIGGDQEAIVDRNRQLAISKYNKNVEKKVQELRKAYLKDQNENIKKLKEIDKEIAKYKQLKASKRKNKKGELINYDLDIQRLEQRKNDINKERKNRFSRYMIDKTAAGGTVSDDEVKAASDETWVQARNREYKERREALAREQGENYQHAEGIINKVLDNINDKIYTFLYGERRGGARQGGEEYREGLIKSIKKKADDFFKEVKTRFTAVADIIKEKFEGIKENIIAPFMEGFKSVGYGVKNFFLGNAATGRTIEKDGFIAVSKGEMVIPSEYNRDYHGPTNKYAQLGREASMINRWKSDRNLPLLGSYAKGGTVGEDNSNKKKNKKRNRKRNQNTNTNQQTDDIRNSEIYQTTRNKTNEFIDKVAEALRNEYDDLQKNLLGDEYKAKNKKLFNLEKYGLDASPKTAGKAAGGAAVGLLVGGLVGMPLIGAATGAAASLVAGSEKLQHKLFGEKDAEGKYSGGLFGPGLSKLIKDIIPSYSKFMAGGAIAGALNLIPGGVVGGLVIGSALKYASDNEKIHDYLFGDSGLLGKGMDQKIKKLGPKMGIGAGIMALASPFGLGLVPSLMLGAGIGFISDTERFKNEIFGFKDSNGNRQGGLVGIFKEEIINPLADGVKNLLQNGEKYIMENFLSPLGRLIGNIGDTIGGMLKSTRDWFTQMVSDKIFGYITPALQGFVKTVRQKLGAVIDVPLGMVKAIGKLPGKAMNFVSGGLERFNVAHGWSSKNVAERAKMWENDNILKNAYIHDATGVGALFKGGRNKARNRAYDVGLANMNIDEINSGLDSLKIYDTVVSNNKFAAARLKKEFYTRFIGDTHGTKADPKYIQKLLNSDNYEEVRKYLKNLNENGQLDENTYEKLRNSLSSAESSVSALNKGSLSSIKDNAFKFAARLGLTEDDLKNSKKWINKIGKDKSFFGGNGKATTDAAGTENNKLSDVINPVNDIKGILNSILDAITGASRKTEEEKNAEHKLKTLKESYEDELERASRGIFVDPNDREIQEEAIRHSREEINSISQILRNGWGSRYISNIGRAIKRKGRRLKFRAISGIGKLGSIFRNIKNTNIDLGGTDFYGEPVHLDEHYNHIDTGDTFGLGSGSGLYNFYGGDSQLDEDGNPKTKIVTDNDGNVLEYERNSRGGYELSKNPMNTIVMRAKKRASAIKEKAYKSLGSIGGFFSKLFGKKEEKKEKKKGILETLLGVGGGVLGGIGGLLGGLGVGGILKIGAGLVGVGFLGNFLEKHPEVGEKLKAIFIGTEEKPGLMLHIKNGIVNHVLPMMSNWWEKHGEAITKSILDGLGVVAGSIIKSIPTTFDGIVNLAKRLVFGSQENEKTYTDENGNIVHEETDKNGRKTITTTDPNTGTSSTKVEETNQTIGATVKDSSGNAIVSSTTGETVTNSFKDKSIGEKWFKKGVLINGLAKGQLSKVPLPLIGKSKVTKIIGEGAGKALNNILTKLFGMLAKFTGKVGGEGVQAMVENFSENLAKAGGTKLGGLVSKLGLVNTIFIAAAVENGFEDAPSILGIVREPTFGERLIAAVANGLNEAIPGIGGIIKTETILGFIISALSSAGIINKDSQLLKDRAEATRIVNEFNAANGTTWSIREYNKNYNGWYTNQEKIGNALKNGATTVKNFFTGGNNNQPIIYGNTQTTHTTPNGTFGGTTGAQFGNGSGLYNFTGGASGKQQLSENDIDPVQIAINRAISRYVSANSKFIDPVNDILNMIDYMDVTKHPKTDGFSKISDKYKNTNIYVPMKLANYFIGNALPFARIISLVYSKLDKVIDKAQSSTSNISSFLNNISSGLLGNISSGISSAGGKIASWAGGLFDKITGNTSSTTDTSTTDTSTTNTNSTTADATASGSHVSQKGVFRRFGHSTVDENGCGPAVAATVLREYGKNATLDGAVDFANAGGYVAGASNVGTRSSYFGDIFARNGISSSYTNRKSDIRRAVNSGRPTVLLGQDASNRSKFNSPFGPNPHYVVASGTTRNGGVIINDPELDRPAIYSKNILNKSKLGIMTGGDSGMSIADLKKDTYADANAKKAASSSTTTSSVVDEDAATWNFLKSVGFTDAGAAGLMGNLYAESGLKSNKVEKASLMLNPPSYQGHTYAKDYGINYDDVTYTAAVDKGLKEGVKGSAETNLNPKFGIIPEYEFVHMPWRVKNNTKFGQNGYGLVQWTSPGRKQALYNYIKSKGVSISDKKSQLEYLVNELKTTSDYRNVYSTLTSSNNLQSASDVVLKEFEQPDGAASKSAERLQFSQKYYNKYSNNPVANATFADGTTIESTGTGGANISFPTYNLSESQLKGVANILQHEQSGIRGRYAEASLMANLLDAKDESKANAAALEEYLTRPPKKNWFASGRDRYNAGKAGNVKIEDTALKAAIDIFNNGKRTMPRYINEHDCFSDISSTNPEIDKKNKSAYVPNVTKVKNRYGSTWTFYSFPDDKADPFGYTSDELRSKWGEAHYDIDENGNLTVPSGFTEGASGATGFANDNSSTNSGTDFWSTISNIFSTVLNKAFGTMGKVGDALSSLFGFNTVTTTNTSANTEGFANSATTGQVGVSSVAATSGSMVNGFPYYMQSDPQWGSHPYGNHGTLSSSACGPTSMAMVMKSYGENVTPVETADWSAQHGYRAKSGTDWDFFKAIGNTAGLTVNQFDPDVGRVKQDIQNGIPVIGSMRAGNFTTGGHFVVFTGMDSAGHIYVNDPSSSTRTSHSWEASQSLGQAKQFWEISKNGKGSLGQITVTDPSLAGAAGGSSGLYDFYGGASIRYATQGKGDTEHTVQYRTYMNDFPYYMQRDNEWRNKAYGWHGVLDDAACGPSSMSMVMNSYGYPATPLSMANWSGDHGYRDENGTKWAFFKALGDEVGLDVKEFAPDIERVKQDIQNGIPVICSMRQGNFTTGGHFVVITGIDKNGNVYINDPYNLTRTSHPWTVEESLAQGKRFWEISKNGKGSLKEITKIGTPSLAGSAHGSGSGLYRLYGGATNPSNRYNIDPLIAADISRQSDLSSDYSITTSKPKDHSIDYTAPNAVVTANTSKKKSQYLGVSDLNRSLYANKNAWNKSSANFHTLDTDMSSLYAWNKKKASKKKKYKKYSTSAPVSAVNNIIEDNNAIISEKLDALIAVTSGLISKCRSKMGPNADIIISNAKANISLSSDETISQKLTNLNNITSGIINNTNVTSPGGITTSSNVYIPKKKVRKIVRGGSSGLAGINSIYNFIGGDSGLDITSATTEIDKLILNIDALSKLIIPGGLTGPDNILAKYIDPSNTNAPTVTTNNSESIEDKIKKLAINIDILSKVYISSNNIVGGASSIRSIIDNDLDNRNASISYTRRRSTQDEDEFNANQARWAKLNGRVIDDDLDNRNASMASLIKATTRDDDEFNANQARWAKATRRVNDDDLDNYNASIAYKRNKATQEADETLAGLSNQYKNRNSSRSSSSYSSPSSNGSSYTGNTSSSAGYGGTGISPEVASGILEYLKIIAENTTNNASIKTIVEILTSLTKIIGATNQASVQEQSNVTQSNAEDDARREKIQSELNTVMTQLRQIAQSA